MVNEEHLGILKKGVEVWNKWRENNSSIIPDLEGIDLRGGKLMKVNFRGANLKKACLIDADLCEAELEQAELSRADLKNVTLRKAFLVGAYLDGANLRGADLEKAYLDETYFRDTNLRGANLSKACLIDADLSNACLIGASLQGAFLQRANLRGAILQKVDLREANLNGALMVGVNLEGANLSDSKVYGVSVWSIKGLESAKQTNLRITPEGEPEIRVDNLEVAQFIYLMLHNEKIRNILDSIASKAVLILGRFTPERKAILDAIRDELRKRNYLPILFDFEKPTSRDLTETVSTLAHIARFVIADITEAKSIPQELAVIVPNLPSVPIQPIILASQREYGMFEHFKRYAWVLEIHQYNDPDDLLSCLVEKVIAPAEAKAKELQKKD